MDIIPQRTVSMCLHQPIQSQLVPLKVPGHSMLSRASLPWETKKERWDKKLRYNILIYFKKYNSQWNIHFWCCSCVSRFRLRKCGCHLTIYVFRCERLNFGCCFFCLALVQDTHHNLVILNLKEMSDHKKTKVAFNIVSLNSMQKLENKLYQDLCIPHTSLSSSKLCLVVCILY